MTASQIISYAFYAMSLASIICLVVFLCMYWGRKRKKAKIVRQSRHAANDGSHDLQSMNDTLEQQKKLAQEFNDAVESKMTAIKQVLSQGLQRNEELYERQQALGRQLSEMEDAIRNIRQQGELFVSGDNMEVAQAGMPNITRIQEELKKMVPPSVEEEEDDIPFDLDPPKGEESGCDSLSPAKPANPEKARDAFRVMLHLAEEAGDSGGEGVPQNHNGEQE